MQSKLPQSGLPQSRKIRWNRLVILIAGVLGVLLVYWIGTVILLGLAVLGRRQQALV